MPSTSEIAVLDKRMLITTKRLIHQQLVCTSILCFTELSTGSCLLFVFLGVNRQLLFRILLIGVVRVKLLFISRHTQPKVCRRKFRAHTNASNLLGCSNRFYSGKPQLVSGWDIAAPTGFQATPNGDERFAIVPSVLFGS